MFLYIFSIFLVVASNTMYHICQKSTPEQVNPFAALLVTYATATAITAVTLFFYKPENGLIESI